MRARRTRIRLRRPAGRRSSPTPAKLADLYELAAALLKQRDDLVRWSQVEMKQTRDVIRRLVPKLSRSELASARACAALLSGWCDTLEAIHASALLHQAAESGPALEDFRKAVQL